MRTRAAQTLFALAAIIVMVLILSLPIPPARSWEQSLTIRLLIAAAGFLVAVVTLSLTPRIGRAIGLVMGTASLAQMMVSMFGLSRGTPPSATVIAIGLTPWLIGAIAGALLLRDATTKRLGHPSMPNTR